MSPAEAGEPGQTRVYGIRHHGPGSARSLRSALAEFRPDTVLIEGPADADPLVIHTAAASMAPPVALLGYIADEPARAAFWPYAVFSPEWQALRYAVDNEVPVRFCDLPAAQVLAVDDRSGGRDALAELAAAGGYDDAERWWDAVVESSSDAGTFAAITEAMAALRETAVVEPEPATGDPEPAATADDPAGGLGGLPAAAVDGTGDADPVAPEPEPLVLDRHTLIREAHMRQVLRKARRDGARRIAVVCGAWHAPALQEPLGPAAADLRLLKGLPKVKAT
ncbi:MAG: hypothetical protein HOQ44_13665, partial [Nocardia sp.]|nr:hypothetical protein [Nocardia sp.]